MDDITFYFVLEEENLARIKCGGEISRHKGLAGTLGCFVIHNPKKYPSSKSLCLLTARHVLDRKEIFYTGQPENIRDFIPYSCYNMDLYIEKIMTSMYDKCTVEFKDSSNNPCSVSLIPYGQNWNTLKGTAVYMWGAETKPGKGVISREKVVNEKEGYTYIAVESSLSNTDFAVHGDSGAVVCIEDKKLKRVSALGILKSRYKVQEDGQDDTKFKFQYIVIPMEDGLRYLMSVHDADITLCTVKDFEELKRSLDTCKSK